MDNSAKPIVLKHGFTLIEFIVVIVLMGIIGGVSAKILSEGFNAYLTMQNTTEANWQGQLAIERMSRDIRQVRSAADIVTRLSGQFTFVDTGGNSIDYTLSGTSLMRNSQVLAEGVTSLSFAYLDGNGDAVAGNTNVHYITITLNINRNNTNYNLTTSVYLRDLSL